MYRQKLNYDFFDYAAPDPASGTVFETMLQELEAGNDIQSILNSHKEWEYCYHLSPIRGNIVELFQIEKTDAVLEIGGQAGALTGEIAKRCAHVDCVTCSELMAKISENRYKDFENIKIYVAGLEHISFTHQYDVITLMGAFENAPQYMKTPNPYIAILQLAHSLLRQGGRLYLGCNNRFGLRYLAGYYDEQTRKPFGGIAGGNRKEIGTTFSRAELIELLNSAGFSEDLTYFYYPFPDYGFPEIVYSDDHFPKITAHMDVNTNYISPRLVCFDENEVYHTLSSIEERKMLANSFVVEAVKEGK